MYQDLEFCKKRKVQTLQILPKAQNNRKFRVFFAGLALRA